MPELPEVETVCRGIAPHIAGATILGVKARRRDLRVPLPADFEHTLTGRRVVRVSRRAKYVLIHLDNRKIWVVHLGMSGSLVLHEAKPESHRRHDHVVVSFSSGMHLVFHDPRRFGLMDVVQEEAMDASRLFSGLGVEPLDAGTDATHLHALLQASKAPVKTVIMDQRKIVGIGNIYACEALFRSNIHPARPACTITRKEADKLIISIKQVLEEAIASGGSTLRDYVRSSGDAGYFQHAFQVYGRSRQPCMVCKTPIASMRQAGRSTFFCPRCQKDK